MRENYDYYRAGQSELKAYPPAKDKLQWGSVLKTSSGEKIRLGLTMSEVIEHH